MRSSLPHYQGDYLPLSEYRSAIKSSRNDSISESYIFTDPKSDMLIITSIMDKSFFTALFLKLVTDYTDLHGFTCFFRNYSGSHQYVTASRFCGAVSITIRGIAHPYRSTDQRKNHIAMICLSGYFFSVKFV